jgi:hypothetical protein
VGIVQYKWVREAMKRPEKILISGQAKYPQGSTATSVYEKLAIAVIVDTNTWTPCEIDSTLITKAAKDFIAEKVRQYPLTEPPNRIIADLECCFYAGSKKTVIAAVKNLYNNAFEVYQEFTSLQQK